MLCDLLFSKCVQVIEQHSSLFTGSSRSRSSSVTSWDSLHGNALMTTSCEQSSRCYSAPLDQGELQQELVVKAIRVKKKKRRQQGKEGKRQTDQTDRQRDRQSYRLRERWT